MTLAAVAVEGRDADEGRDAAAVDAAAFVEEGLTGAAIGEAVRKARVQTIAGVRGRYAAP